MSAIQLLSGLLVQGILYSLAAGALCYLLLLLLLGLFPCSSAAAKYGLCNAIQLLIALAFLQPFVRAALANRPASLIPSQEVGSVQMITVSGPALPAAAAAQAAPASHFSELAARGLSLLEEQSSLIFALYTCGLFLFLLRLAAGYGALRRLRTQGLLEPDESWRRLMSGALDRLCIRRPVKLAFSAVAQAPCIIGRAKALVLIPVALAARLSTEQAEAVLLHELAHYRQYHYYLNLAGQINAVLQFFNPFVWLTGRLARRYREYTADALAARCSLQVALAESLVLIAQQQTAYTGFALSLQSSKNQLLHRIQNLLTMKANAFSSRTLLISFCIAAVIAFSCYSRLNALPAGKPAAPEDTLALIARQMKAQDNANYLLVEAIRDSLIRFDRPYNFTYDAGAVYIDSVLLPGPYQSRYAGMIQALPSYKKVSFWSSRGDGISRKEVMDGASTFRGYRFTFLNGAENPDTTAAAATPAVTGPKSHANSGSILKALLADRIIDTLQPALITYKGAALTINGKAITGAPGRKYAELLRLHAGFLPVAADSTTTLRIFPEGVMTPTIVHSDQSVLQFPRQAGQVPYLVAQPARQAPPAPEQYELLRRALAADGLADTAYTVHLTYMLKGMFVNDRPLSGAQLSRYEELLIRGFGFRRPVLESDWVDMTF